MYKLTYFIICCIYLNEGGYVYILTHVYSRRSIYASKCTLSYLFCGVYEEIIILAITRTIMDVEITELHYCGVYEKINLAMCFAYYICKTIFIHIIPRCYHSIQFIYFCSIWTHLKDWTILKSRKIVKSFIFIFINMEE